MDTNQVEEHLASLVVPPATPIAVKCHMRASLGPQLERSEIYEVDLERLRVEYFIPDDFRMTILSLDDRVVSPPLGCVCLLCGRI